MASEYLKWKYRDVQPDAPVERTRKQKAANWWHYHRWPLLLAALLLAAGADILHNALGIGAVNPDYQIACVISAPLGDDALAALKERFAALGEDCDGDGRVTVQVNAYVDMTVSQDSDAARYAEAARIKLMADMEACESYFFICDDPETLHANYDILANTVGDIAGVSEAIDCHLLSDYPSLSALCEEYENLSELYLARRGFWGERICKYREQCDILWNALTEGAKS